MIERIVLAYDEEPETAAALVRLTNLHRAEIVAVILELGRGLRPGLPEGLEELRDRALAAGAARAHVLDVRDEFARDFVLPALKADACDRGGCPSSAALGRALVAKKLVDIAAIEQADALAHCGAGERPLALESAVGALNPSLIVLPPAPESSSGDAIGRPRPPGIANDRLWRAGGNLWGRTVSWRCGDAPAEPPVCAMTPLPAECPDEPAFVEIAFEHGTPTAINGVTMPLVELIASLGTIAGAHGVGRFDQMSSDAAGNRWCNVREAPAGVVLHAAHEGLQRMVAPAEADRFLASVRAEYAGLVENGLWFSPLREALDASVNLIQLRVTGTIQMELFKGSRTVVRAASPFALGGRRRVPIESKRSLGLPDAVIARQAD
jgi:argininosuccinate synthase